MKTLLVPSDFGTAAANALSYAGALATQTGGRVVVMHAYQVPVLAPLPSGGAFAQALPAKEIEAGFRSRLSDVIEHARRNHPQVTYEPLLLQGLLDDVLAEATRDIAADLVVTGTDGAHGLKQALAGTNSAEVLAKANCPVLVVPAEARFRGLDQIVFATDLAAAPVPETQLVADLARAYKSEISFLHIAHGASREITENDWDAFGRRFPYDRISFHLHHGSESVEEGIRTFAGKLSADLIVMTTRRRGFWEAMFNPSQSKRMAYHTHIPLLVLHE
ncbi:MAG: universal stress protein [Cytophagales bacterium]|nr:universal stress protein [Cytophagales bacterium]